MTTEIVLVLLVVVALIVGPFATLRAITHFRATKADRDAIRRAAEQQRPDDEPEDR